MKLSFIVSGLTLPSIVRACPFCHSDRAAEVQAGIVSTLRDSALLFSALSPFLILSLMVVAMHFNFHIKLISFLSRSQHDDAKSKEYYENKSTELT